MKKLLFTTFTCMILGVAIAQPGRGHQFGAPGNPPLRMQEGRREKIELYKVQFITEKLNLSKSEAEDFWPVYNDHRKAVEAIIANRTGDEIQMEEAMLVAKKKYKNDLKPVLKTEERINEALKVEREFLKTIRFEMMRRKGIGS